MFTGGGERCEGAIAALVKFAKVLVTGGAGRLGRFVVAELTSRCEVSVLDRAVGAAPVAFSVDVLDLGALSAAMRGFDAVIHLAAIDSSVTASPEVVFDTNVRGTWNVLHAAQQAGVGRTVICSSSSAAGLDYTNPRMPPLYLPIDEAHPLRPSQAYGLSKQLDEEIARSFGHRGGMEVVCLRPAWVMFPEAVRRVMAERQGGTLPAAPGRHREPWPLLRSYVAPDDAARAFRLALELPGVPHGVFIITAADTFEPEPTLVHLERTYGAGLPVRKPEVYANDPRASAWDITRAREILGWNPSRHWDEFSAQF
jgi:nucleoside-diphosphate-sugar epimerase